MHKLLLRLSPIGLPFALLVGVVAVLTLWDSSSPTPGLGLAFFGSVLLILVWIGVAIVGVVGAVVTIVAVARERVPKQSIRWWRWLVVPSIVVVTVAAVWSDAPLHARFELSRDELEDIARNARTHPHATRFHGGWIGREVGSYDITDVGIDRGIVHFTVAASSWSGLIYGFAFSPDRSPRTDGVRYHEFDGDWYLWESQALFYVD